MMKTAQNEAHRKLAQTAMSKPFSDIPVPVEFILAERTISLGEVAAFQLGDLLRLEGSDPQDLRLVIAGVTAGRARSLESQPPSVEITGWQKKV